MPRPSDCPHLMQKDCPSVWLIASREPLSQLLPASDVAQSRMLAICFSLAFRNQLLTSLHPLGKLTSNLKYTSGVSACRMGLNGATLQDEENIIL